MKMLEFQGGGEKGSRRTHLRRSSPSSPFLYSERREGGDRGDSRPIFFFSFPFVPFRFIADEAREGAKTGKWVPLGHYKLEAHQ